MVTLFLSYLDIEKWVKVDLNITVSTDPQL